MHHLHHQKYGHPDSEVCHSCCQGPQVGAPGIIWALAVRALPIIITDMITASTKSLTLHIHPPIESSLYVPRTIIGTKRKNFKIERFTNSTSCREGQSSRQYVSSGRSP